MNNKISKKVTAGVLSVLVFGSQFPSGSAHENTCNCNAEYYSNLRVNENRSHVKTKGVFDVPSLKEALKRANRYYGCLGYDFMNAFMGVSLESRGGRVKVRVWDESFELAYDKLVNKETGEIDEIEVPSCICSISSGVFKDILKNANAQGKKIKKVILPEYLRRAAEDIFADVSVDSVVFESNSSDELNTNVFKGALNIGAVFVPKRFEEKVKADLKGKNIRVFEDFELKNAFDIEGLKDAIMDALANKKEITFKRYNTGYQSLLVGDKEFRPDYNKLLDEKTGKIEILELPYGISKIGCDALIYDIGDRCKKKILAYKEINKLVIPDTVTSIGTDVFFYTGINHLVLSKNLKFLSRGAFEFSLFNLIFDDHPKCEINKITAPAKFKSKLKKTFKNQKTEFNFI